MLPVVEAGTVVALHEYYSKAPLPFTGNRAGKWQALGRVAGSGAVDITFPGTGKVDALAVRAQRRRH